MKDRKKNPFAPSQGRFLADDTPMLQGDSKAQLAEFRACQDGATVLEPRGQKRPVGRPAPPRLPGHGGVPGRGEWENVRPLEAPTTPPPQVAFSRTWDRQRGRVNSFPARQQGRLVHLLRARQLF